MPRAPRFWGPRAYSLLFFPHFFSPCFSARLKQCAIKLDPDGFFCSMFQRGAPKSSRSPENVWPQNLKIEAPNSRAQNGFFVSCFSAGSKQRGAPKSPRPLKAKPPNEKTTRPQSLKSEAPKAGPQTNFFVASLGKGLQGAPI